MKLHKRYKALKDKVNVILVVLCSSLCVALIVHLIRDFMIWLTS